MVGVPERFIRNRAAGEPELVAAIADATTPDYVCIRAIIALASETGDRTARLTAMGRDFVVEVRRVQGADGSAALLAAAPSLQERVLEHAARQLVGSGGRKAIAMQRLARDVAVPRRTLYNMHPATELAAACRRRAQTIWRARFEQRVLAAATDPKGRLFAVFDAIDAWVGSERFRADQVLCACASFSADVRDDDLREHLAEIERFATTLAAAARLRAPAAFGVFVTTTVAGVPAWFDRRAAAHAASIAFVERELARRR